MFCAACAPQPTIVIPTLASLPTITPSATPTETPEATATASSTPTLTLTPSATATETATNTPTMTNTPTPTPTATATNTPTPVYSAFGTHAGRLDEAGVQAVLASSFERPVYTFSGRAGEVITVRLRRVEGSLDPALLLIDPRGGVVASDDDAGGAIGMDADSALLNGVPLPLDGEYAVQVIGGGGTGTYALTLERNASLPIMTAAPPTSTPMVNIASEAIPAEDGSRLVEHTPISGEISRAGELDRYFIEANAGDALTVLVRVPDGSRLRPLLEIYDLDGQVIASMNLANSGTRAAVIASPVLIAEAGSYGVYLTGENDSTGAYTLAFGRGAAAEDRVVGMLPVDEAVQGTLDQPGLRDVWLLDARAGDRINVQVSGGLSLELAALEGSTLASGSEVLVDVPIGTTGRYLLRVTDVNARAIGRYTIRWSYALAAPTETPAPRRAILLSVDESIGGGATVEHAFYGHAGWIVSIQVRAFDPFDPLAVLISPDGSVLARSDDSGGTLNPSFEVVLPADGTYRVQVTAYGSAGGRASLTVEGRVE